MNIRLSLEDLKAFDRDEDAVELPDGSGYAGTLNIYHEIHCVVRFFFSFSKSISINVVQLTNRKEMASHPHVPRTLLPQPHRSSTRNEQITF